MPPHSASVVVSEQPQSASTSPSPSLLSESLPTSTMPTTSASSSSSPSSSSSTNPLKSTAAARQHHHDHDREGDAAIAPGALLSIDLRVTSAAAKRAEILDSFHATFSLYEDLFSTIAPEAMYKRADALRHPLIFYYAHTAVLYVNKFVLARILTPKDRVNEKIEAQCAVGVDEMSWDDLLPEHYDWPTVDAVREYRNTVRKMVNDVITALPLEDHSVITWESPFWAVLMGIEHERIHLETSSVLIRQLPVDDLKQHPKFQASKEWRSDVSQIPSNPLIDVSAGTVSIGRNKVETSKASFYGWDNEYGNHVANVDEFKASEKLISNGQFLAFVRDGGYQTQAYWTEEGWGYVQSLNVKHPRFWIPVGDDSYVQRNTFDVTESMPWDWPVEVNYLEAKAYCNWCAAKTGLPIRLPTEDEWHRLRDLNAPARASNDGEHERPANLGLRGPASSVPVDRFRHGDFYDVVGNVWQWTETPIYPLDGFQVHPLYDDFTTPTFDNRHNIFKGGSWISTGNEQLAVSRYAFRRHFYQHAGFRMVQSNTQVASPASLSNPYETDELVTMYQEFHYGPQTRIPVENFAVAIAKLCEEATRLDSPSTQRRRVLDLGCAVGRSSFELARWFDQVVGVDFSARFIDVGVQLALQRRLRWTIRTEGDLRALREASLDDMGVTQAMSDRVTFIQGDACNLKDLPVLKDFDVVLAANLIDRLYEPASFLESIGERIVKGGLLVMLSPYTWLEEYTPREKWIGGRKDPRTGETITTFHGLTDALTAAGYEFLRGPIDVPFVIRETQRKYQHSFSEASIWRKL